MKKKAVVFCMVDVVSDLHVKEFGVRPLVIGEVPGACTLFGSFSELCGGWAVVGTTSTRCTIAISRRDDGMVRLYNTVANDRKRFPLASIKYRKEDRWGNAVKGAVADLAAGGAELSGMDISLGGDVLRGDRVSVGEALALVTCVAINRLCSLGMDRSALAQAAYRSLRSFNGLEGRLADLTTMLACRPGKVLFFDLGSLQYEEIEFPFGRKEGEWVAILLESRVSQSPLREESEVRRKDTRAAFARLRKAEEGRAVRDVQEGDLLAGSLHFTESVRHWCSYVLMESQESVHAARILHEKDAPALGRVMNRVQSGLRNVMEMTCPETDWLAKRAKETEGCLGAVQVSDGMEGNMLLLCNHAGFEGYKRRLEDYEHIFGFHPRYEIFRSIGQARVTDL